MDLASLERLLSLFFRKKLNPTLISFFGAANIAIYRHKAKAKFLAMKFVTQSILQTFVLLFDTLVSY